MDSIISALYHSELHLDKSHADEHSEKAILIESFQQTAKWLLKSIDGEKEREWLDDLADINKQLIELVGFEKFREGFTLGMRLATDTFYSSHHLGD